MPIWLIYSLLSAIFAALVTIFAKIGISQVDSTLATTIRSIIMAISLILISVFAHKFELAGTISQKNLLYIILAGLSGAASWFFYFLALKYGNPTAVSSIDRLSIVFIFIFALVLLGEPFNIKVFVGIITIVFGAVIITFSH